MRTLRLSMAALAFCVALPSFAALQFSEIVEGFSNLKAGPGSPVSNATFTIGHMKLTMKNGVIAPVKIKDTTVAVFFKGDGTLDYDSVDPIEQPVLKHNARGQNVKLTAAGAGTHVTNDVREVLLYGAGIELPAASGGSTDVSADFKEHIDEFGRDRSTAVVNLFLLQNGAPAGKLVRAEMRAGRELYNYVYDASDTMNEYLFALRQPDALIGEFRKRLYPVILSSQTIGRDRKAVPPQPVMLTNIDYTLIADGDNAKITIAETYTRDSEQRKSMRINLHSELFVKPGAPNRQFHLLSVMDPKGKSVSFNHKNDEVVVDLGTVAGKSFDLTFSVEGDFLIRADNDAAWQLGVAPWFPQPDFGGQFYTVHSLVKVKKPFIAIAPGTTIRKGEEGDFYVVENKIDKPVQFAVVHGGKYEVTEEVRSGLTVRVASYAGKNERAAKQLTNLAYSIIDYYQWFLGPFPFDEFNIIQVNSFGYGQAPPGTMFITNEAFNSMVGEVNKFVGSAGFGINHRFAHEIAHQYWAHVVKMPSPEEQWLTESFAEYSSALMIKKIKGDGAYNKMINTWRDNARQATSSAPIPLANWLAGNDAGRKRSYLVYDKGAYLLYTLHKQLGDSVFLTFMKSYQKSFRWKFGTTNDVAGLLQFITKQDFNPFFDQYFWGTAMPD